MTTTCARLVAIVAVALGESACGNGQQFLAGDLCGQAAAANNNVASKVVTCSAADSTFAGGFSPCFDINACETNLKACTAFDRQVLSAEADCQNTYADNSDCSFAGYSTFQTCASNAQSLNDGGDALSAACSAAFAANPGICAIPDAGS